MERYMYQDDSFERMLKQKTDEYRMYPSDKTWASIQNKLHKPSNRFHWKTVPFLAILIVVSLHLTNSDTVQTKHAFIIQGDVAVNTIAASTKTVKSLSPNQQLSTKKQLVAVTNNTQKVAEAKIAVITPVEKTEDEINRPTLPITEVSAVIPSSAETANNTQTISETIAEEKMPAIILHEHTPAGYKPEGIVKQPALQSAFIAITETVPVTETSIENKTDAELNYEVHVPVITKKKEPRQLQVYASPSLSYRVLIAENKLWFGNVPLNPENEVTHHMSVGWEAGAAILFPVAKKWKFRTGVQMNYTRYDVEAFKTMPANATVRLSNTSVLNRPAALANETGLLIKEVANETYQLSIPVGVEFSIAKGKRLQWAVAGNLQPTYLLKASGYLVTNDYKNYIKAPDLLSNMNLNTAVETFFRWDAGGFQLQAGPQFRYQLFSNVTSTYPIREHLVDYGFKIGFIKNLR